MAEAGTAMLCVLLTSLLQFCSSEAKWSLAVPVLPLMGWDQHGEPAPGPRASTGPVPGTGCQGWGPVVMFTPGVVHLSGIHIILLVC